MRDLSDLLWCDLVSDAERIAFLESGRAVATGLIAPAMVSEIVEVFRFRSQAQKWSTKYTVDHCEFRQSGADIVFSGEPK